MASIGNSSCRHCGGGFSAVLADLGEIPVANDYIVAPIAGQADPTTGLKVVVCGNCRLAQTVDLKAASDLFRDDYAYFSSASSGWLRHAREYVTAMVDRFGLDVQSRHVELASNDGYLLQYARAKGLKVLGVEPCRSVAVAARALDIETRVEFFGQDYAATLLQEGWQADLITANNVFAHVPDVNDFARGIRTLLKPQGVATIEVQHLMRLMQSNQFDTIYHEHFSYYSLFSALRVFGSAGLRVFDVEELPTHGGSLRYYVCRDAAEHPETPAVARILEEELAFGIDRDATYAAFADKIVALRTSFRDLLLGLKARGKSIAGYGAPAKGTTLLNYCGIGADVIDFTVDKAASKQGRMIPGVRIPIRPPEALNEAKPDYVVILPWNLKSEIVAQLSEGEDWGAQFITAIPEPEVFARPNIPSEMVRLSA